MCCLFGLLDYKGTLALKERQRILRKLSIECEARGTDATGIAYFVNNHLTVQKAPKPANKLRFRLSGQARCVMGHTRMTTQGDERFNKNNHPFFGKAGATRFALAHNGVLYNDQSLRKQYALPPTDIETDSYAAVQLIEASGELGFGSIARMAEAVRGSFSFTIMDDKSGVYFVKGSNPLALYHFERLGLYVYAETIPRHGKAGFGCQSPAPALHTGL
jgi:glucosamine 6-phosphate synthetase-like amidotransferase/phosphosugar isomerase protein